MKNIYLVNATGVGQRTLIGRAFVILAEDAAHAKRSARNTLKEDPSWEKFDVTITTSVATDAILYTVQEYLKRRGAL
jgi:hypothetical protein